MKQIHDVRVRDRKVSLKFVSLIFVMLLASSLGYYVGSATVQPNIYLDDLPATATYVVKTDGVNYWAVHYDGHIAYQGTNATVLINSALDSAGEVFLKAGTYSMDGELQVHSNTLLYGEGSKTILRASRVYGSMITQNGYVDIAPFGTAVQNVTIRDLYLDGSDKANRGIHGRFNNTHIENNYFVNVVGYFTKILYSSDIWIQNNYGYSSSAGDGYDVLYSLHAVISGNQAYQVYDDSFSVAHSNYTTVEANIVQAMGASGLGSGIAVWGNSHYITVANNIVRDSATHGLKAEVYESKDPSEITFIGNQVFNSGYYGIVVISSATGNDTIKFLTIIGNTLNKTQRTGIHILGAGYSKIIGNTILDVSQLSDNAYDGITLDYSAGANTYSNSWLIEGNQIYKTLSNDARYGIFLTSAYHICIGNQVTNGQTGKIQNSSTGSVVEHNLESGFI